jgi:hypothetical protein
LEQLQEMASIRKYFADKDKSPIHIESQKDSMFIMHDLFNFICISFFIVYDVYYLSTCTVWEFIGTSQICAESVEVSRILMVSFIAYIIVDTLWISFYPHIVTAGALPVIIHHLMTLVYMIVPYQIPQFHWHMGLVLLVEINTWLITLRRNLPIPSMAYELTDLVFLITWVIFRWIMCPVCCVFFFLESQRYGKENNQPTNLIQLATLLQVLLTLLGFHWSIDLVKKRFGKKPDQLKR